MTAVARVEAALREWASAEFGPGARVEVSGPEPRDWSFLFSLTSASSGGTRDLIAKIPRWEEAPTLEAALAAGPQDTTREEHRVLAAVAAMVAGSGDPGLAAVPVLAYLPGLNAVVTERIDAVPLRRRLGGPGGAAAVAAAGRWLRRFHAEVGEARTAWCEAGSVIATLEHAASGLPARRAAGPREHLAALADRAAGLQGHSAPHAGLHGDYNLANVLVDRSGRVAVLDPNLEWGPAAADAAKFLTALRVRRVRALTLGLAGRHGLAALERAFLHESGVEDDALLRFLRAAATLERWIEMEHRVEGLPRRSPIRWAAPVARRHFAAEADALLDT